MGRPPLRNTGNVSNDRKHTVGYLAEKTGLGKPTLHRILKSDFKLSKASARWVLRFLSVDDCEHNPAGYNCKLSDAIHNLNDVRRWVTPTVGKISAQT